jgi:hypothetical protein
MTKTVGQYSCDNVRLNKKLEIFCQRFRGLNETAESWTKMCTSDSAVSMRQGNRNFAHDYLDFLGENEAICKTTLGHESGP